MSVTTRYTLAILVLIQCGQSLIGERRLCSPLQMRTPSDTWETLRGHRSGLRDGTHRNRHALVSSEAERVELEYFVQVEHLLQLMRNRAAKFLLGDALLDSQANWNLGVTPADSAASIASYHFVSFKLTTL